MSRQLQVGDQIFREFTDVWGERLFKSIETIERVTKTLAISSNGVRYKRWMYHDVNLGYQAMQYGASSKRDRFIEGEDIIKFRQIVREFNATMRKIRWVDTQKFTNEQKVKIFDTLHSYKD